MSGAIDLDSNGLSDDIDAGENAQSLEFVKDLIVTPPAASEIDEVDSDAPFTVKRNIS
ncbi:hypothetical protein A2U01_0046731, partial [Trifolium medium]|nr:hypothetical protein [Trifolium medium]